MDFVLASIVSAFVGFLFGIVFGKHVVSEAESLKTHVTETVVGMESRIRMEIAEVRGKIASKL